MNKISFLINITIVDNSVEIVKNLSKTRF